MPWAAFRRYATRSEETRHLICPRRPIWFRPNGKIEKEVRLTGKDHGDIPRPNVKEPNYNVNPETGEVYQNGYRVRPARADEIPAE
ncbi:polymorphic toxin type 24 domain-containing protein [uncultured Sporomusa sp.]|uniref:polymorphic toxin type 24 domain-containing protein n=1 Tax=uncultured Sporomusa sp. TaxID=307249 RepID=UPI0033900FC3